MAARLALAVGMPGAGWQTDFEEGWLGHGGVGLAWDGRGQGTPRVPHAVPAAGERGKQLTWNGAAADMGATAFGNGDRAEGSSVRVLIRGWIS